MPNGNGSGRFLSGNKDDEIVFPTFSNPEPKQMDPDVERIVNALKLPDEKEENLFIPELDTVVTDSSDPIPSGKADDDIPRNFFVVHSTQILVVLCCLALVAAGIVFFMVSRSRDTTDDKIAAGITVAGVDVGGMYPGQATQELEETLVSMAGQDFVVNMNGVNVPLEAASLKLQLDIRGAVNAAFQYSRSGEPTPYAVDLRPYLTLDENYVRSVLKKRADLITGSFQQSGFRLEGPAPALESPDFTTSTPCQTLVLSMGTPGAGSSQDEVYRQIVDAICAGQTQVTIQASGEMLNPDPLDLEAIYRTVSIKSVDSVLNPETMEVTGGTYGYTFSLEKAQDLVSKASYGDEIRISMEYIAPQVQTDDSFFPDELAVYEVFCVSMDSPITRKVCQQITGTIVQPNKIFNFREALGDLTNDVDCKLFEPEDDGFCKVATAVYLAALSADMTIQDLYTLPHHDYAPSYIDIGMDVCVCQKNQNLRFRNNTKSPIMVMVDYTDLKIQVRILGVDTRDYYIKVYNKINSTVENRSQVLDYRADSGYTEGEIVQYGHTGYSVETFRSRYEKGTDTLLTTENLGYRVYAMKDQITATITDTAPYRTPKQN